MAFSSLRYLYGLLLSLGLMYGGCVAYPNGAPLSACLDLKPGHNNTPSQGVFNSPYVFSVDGKTYEKGTPVKVNILRGVVKGFIIQAKRQGPGPTAPVGTWISQPGLSKALRCSSIDDTLTHTNREDKSDITLQWQPPDSHVGDVAFYVTIVHAFFVYYHNLESVSISPGQSYFPPTTTTTTTTLKPVPQDTQLSQETTTPLQPSSSGDNGLVAGLQAWELVLVILAAIIGFLIVVFTVAWCIHNQRKKERERYKNPYHNEGTLDRQYTKSPYTEAPYDPSYTPTTYSYRQDHRYDWDRF